jgi:hypothetical protein
VKYNILFLAGFVFSAVGYAMENPLVLATRVEIRKGSLYEADGAVDILVVGLHEQKRLNRSFKIVDKRACSVETVGATQFLRPNGQYVNIMKQKSDSGSEGETEHHPSKIIKHRDYNFDQKLMNSKVLVVVEPELNQRWYNNKRENYTYDKGEEEYSGEEAIRQAGIDLACCYQNVLKEGLRCLGDKEIKSIAIPTLSTSTFFPRRDAARVALSSIFKFIQNNPGAYSYIQMFVKKRFELDIYKSFFSIEPVKNNELKENSESEEEAKKAENFIDSENDQVSRFEKLLIL